MIAMMMTIKLITIKSKSKSKSYFTSRQAGLTVPTMTTLTLIIKTIRKIPQT